MKGSKAVRHTRVNDMDFTITATLTELCEEKRNEFGQPELICYEVYEVVIFNETTGETTPFKWAGNAFDGIEDAIFWLEGEEE
jgi:hypothetical protein